MGAAIEELEGVVFDLILGSGRQANLDRVEVLDDVLVGVVDAGVAFISHHDVEEVGRDPGLRRGAVLDQVVRLSSGWPTSNRVR